MTIELCEIAITVEVADRDLRRAVRLAADRCAEGLREKGFSVTTSDVLSALDDALEHSELVRATESLN